MPRVRTSLLIIGAGPFGLAMASRARHLGLDHVVVGRPMGFWREHMPRGMLLRSGLEWHLDPQERDTLARYASESGVAEPLTLDAYLGYAAWFAERQGIEVHDARVTRLERGFAATLDDGATIEADAVLVATGFRPFVHEPEDVTSRLHAGAWSHTCGDVALERFRGRRCLIVGGRQSAFESAALLLESGAASVDLAYRHDTPAFVPSDWTWVDPMLERMAAEPSWFRGLAPAEREALDRRFWEEGRLKLEPWLAPRIERATLHPRTRVLSHDGRTARLDDGTELPVDHVLLATGYRVDLARLPLLREFDVATRDGFPVLDERLQTSVPGLFLTSLPATRDFGLFFAFTSAVRTSAKLVGDALA